MRKEIAKLIGPIDGNPTPNAERVRLANRARIKRYHDSLKAEAAKLGIPYTRLFDKRKSTFMDMSSPPDDAVSYHARLRASKQETNEP